MATSESLDEAFGNTQCVIGAAAQKGAVGLLKGMTRLPGNATEHLTAPRFLPKVVTVLEKEDG